MLDFHRPTNPPTSPQDAPTPESPHVGFQPQAPTPAHNHGGHSWLMMLMCLPMLVLFGVLLGTGAIGTGGLVYALGCVAMMAAMMFVLNRLNRNG